MPKLRIHISLLLLAALPVLSQTSWTDLDGMRQMSDWEDSANWGGLPVPDAPGTQVLINTPKISKYVVFHQDATVGTLSLLGRESLPSGLLHAEGSEAILRFDNGDIPALFHVGRDGRDVINVPIEFTRDLVVSNSPPSQPWRFHNTLFFDIDASFTPLCADGKASLTFCIRSSSMPWRDRDILSRKQQNVVTGYIEDSLDGAPLSLVKDGSGFLGIACADNAYSGGTTLLGGYLAGINGENMNPPFLPFGSAPLVDIPTTNSASILLYSSKPGTWGPDNGYELRFADGIRLTIGNAADWNAAPLNGPDRIQQIGSLAGNSTNHVISLNHGGKLRVAGPVSLGRSAFLEIRRDNESHLAIPDADFAGGIRQAGPDPVALAKTGLGTLRLGADSTFAGGIAVLTGAVAVASNGALGTGPARFGTNTTLFIECPAYRPAGKLTLAPGTMEVWRHPLARLGSTPDEKAGCRISPGVTLGIGTDMRDLQNKTIVLQGGRLTAYRDHLASKTNAFVVGTGVTFFCVTNSLPIGTPWYGNGSELTSWDRLQQPFTILGPIKEHTTPATLVKTGGDRVELGGYCTYSGGTIITNGTLAVLPSGRLGTGPITLVGNKKDRREPWLRLSVPENLPEGTALHLTSPCRVSLDFDGEAAVSAVTIDDKPLDPGVWAGNGGKGIEHTDKHHFSGPGRLRIAPPQSP